MRVSIATSISVLALLTISCLFGFVSASSKGRSLRPGQTCTCKEAADSYCYKALRPQEVYRKPNGAKILCLRAKCKSYVCSRKGNLRCIAKKLPFYLENHPGHFPLKCYKRVPRPRRTFLSPIDSQPSAELMKPTKFDFKFAGAKLW